MLNRYQTTNTQHQLLLRKNTLVDTMDTFSLSENLSNLWEADCLLSTRPITFFLQKINLLLQQNKIDEAIMVMAQCLSIYPDKSDQLLHYRDIIFLKLFKLSKINDCSFDVFKKSMLSSDISVSVLVVVSHNSCDIAQTISSIKKQTLNNIEIIVVSNIVQDFSLLQALAAVQDYPDYQVLAKDYQSYAEVRNYGIDLARGKYVTFVDSGDSYPAEDTLQLMSACASSNHAFIVGGNILYSNHIDSDQSKLKNKHIDNFTRTGWIETKEYELLYSYQRFLYSRDFLLKNYIHFSDLTHVKFSSFIVDCLANIDKFYAINVPVYLSLYNNENVVYYTKFVLKQVFLCAAKIFARSRDSGDSKLHLSCFEYLNSEECLGSLTKYLTDREVRKIASSALREIEKALLVNAIPQLCIEPIYASLMREDESGLLCSVIMPVYNEEARVERAVRSVLAQTLDSFELICIDDGSSDKSLEVLQRLAKTDARIKVFTQTNAGQSAARNLGINHAKGFYIAFVDADDWVEPTMLEQLVQGMRGEIDVVRCGAKIINDKSVNEPFRMAKLTKIYSARENTCEDITPEVIYYATMVSWDKLYKKDILDDNSIRFSEGLIFEDNEFVIKYLSCCRKMLTIGQNLYNYLQTSVSTMARARISDASRTLDFLQIYENIYKYIVSRPQASKYQSFLARKYEGFLYMAHNWASDQFKPYIKQKAKEQAHNINAEILSGNILQNVKDGQFHKVRGLNNVIVSLTSHPGRISWCNQAIASIYDGTFKPDEVHLYLASTQFPKGLSSLPQNLLALRKYGLKIFWTEDLLSYKKLIPALSKHQNSIIVTIDDDIIYAKNFLEILYSAYEDNPGYIHCMHGHRITFAADGKIAQYKDWEYGAQNVEPSFLNIAVGVGGILYQAHLLHSDVTKSSLFSRYAHKTDDLWFWAMAVLQGTKINIIPDGLKGIQEIEACKPTAMWELNKYLFNDLNLRKILINYPALAEKLYRSQTV